MHSTMLKAKLHNATVTHVKKEYEGSLSIDSELMDYVKIRPYEKILVANLTNGNRFETYAIPAPAGSGTVCLNGPAAHLGSVGDRLVILTFCAVSDQEMAAHRPLILVLGENNRAVGGLKEV